MPLRVVIRSTHTPDDETDDVGRLADDLFQLVRETGDRDETGISFEYSLEPIYHSTDSRGLAATIRTSASLTQYGLTTFTLQISGEVTHHRNVAIAGDRGRQQEYCDSTFPCTKRLTR
jgi:hypothetical protein